MNKYRLGLTLLLLLIAQSSKAGSGASEWEKALNTAMTKWAARIPASSVLPWTVETWTADEKPYHEDHTSIYKAVMNSPGKHDQNALALVAKYRAQVRKTPHDPRAAYRYSYAAYLAAQLSPAFENSGKLVEATQVWDYFPPTHSYEVARMHFLMAARNGPMLTLKSVGERLLRRNPQDFPVKWAVVELLNPSIFPEDKELILLCLQDLVREMPNNPARYTIEGSTFYKIWEGSRKRADGDKAIAAYQKYLQLVPPDDSLRKRAEYTIKYIGERQAGWEKAGQGG